MSVPTDKRGGSGASGGVAHPSAADLENLAREQLGRKKTQRILDHCKQCPRCAELLLEAVSNQPLPRQRLQLSRWNWISIVVLLATVVALFGLLLWLLSSAAGRSPEALEPLDAPSETVYSEQPDSWFEALFTRFTLSPRADTMLRAGPRGVRLIDLRSGDDLRPRLWLDFDGIMGATYDGNGALARYANKRHDLGWFIEVDGELRSTSLPPEATAAWASGNTDVAWTRPPATRAHLGYPPRQRSYDAAGRVLGMAWAPSGAEAYALVMDDEGSATLTRLRRATTRPEVIRAGLDASALPNSLAVSPEGDSVFVALASAAAPRGEERHAPQADRDLDIYGIDVRSGELRRIVATPGDDFWPQVAGGALYWTHNEHRASVVLVPLAAADAASRAGRPLAGYRLDGVNAQLPRWDPRGGRLAYTRGDWRLADWGLPFDVMVQALDDSGAAVGEPEELVVGYHQDLTPAFSPDGRWLAYRSRRSALPVPYYAGPGVADDIFLRAADDLTAPERRLSVAGWEVGGPSWIAADRLVFDTWDREGVPRVSRPWVVTLDARSGDVLSSEPLALPEGVTGSVSAIWSPVADEVLLVERRDPESQTLWLSRPGEARAERLVDFESRTLAGADWVPDGSAIVYAAVLDGRMQLFVIARDGGEPRRLSDDSGSLMHPSVSPDGRWVAATRLEQRKEVRRIALAAVR